MRNRIFRILTPLPLLGVLLAPAACGVASTGCAGAPTTTAVTVLGPWTQTDQDNFQKVLGAFTEKCHIPTVYEGTRAVDQVLQADISKGTPPDVVILPSPGALRQYATQGLVPISGDLTGVAPYSPLWTQLTTVNGNQYAVVVKASVKSLMWYDPKVIQQLWQGPLPTTWTQMTALAGTITAHGGSPWCMGTGSTSESGWPGTDWIEDIVLHEYGTGIYEEWANGVLPWTDPRIVQAWRQWAALLSGVPGGPTSALYTDGTDTDQLMYPPTCYLNHEAFVGGYRKLKLKPVTDFNYFPFPSMGAPGAPASEIGADLAAAFDDSDGARSLIQYLASKDGQEKWPPGNGSLSIDSQVTKDGSIYPDPVTRGMAAILTGPGTLCFDASDLMPPTLSAAFEQAVLTVLGDPQRYMNQPGLDSLLSGLNAASETAYQHQPTKFGCGQ